MSSCLASITFYYSDSLPSVIEFSLRLYLYRSSADFTEFNCPAIVLTKLCNLRDCKLNPLAPPLCWACNQWHQLGLGLALVRGWMPFLPRSAADSNRLDQCQLPVAIGKNEATVAGSKGKGHGAQTLRMCPHRTRTRSRSRNTFRF